MDWGGRGETLFCSMAFTLIQLSFPATAERNKFRRFLCGLDSGNKSQAVAEAEKSILREHVYREAH